MNFFLKFNWKASTSYSPTRTTSKCRQLLHVGNCGSLIKYIINQLSQMLSNLKHGFRTIVCLNLAFVMAHCLLLPHRQTKYCERLIFLMSLKRSQSHKPSNSFSHHPEHHEIPLNYSSEQILPSDHIHCYQVMSIR